LEGTTKEASSIRVPGFCCVEEASEVVQRLNTSLDPCTNFHDFVCMRRAADMNSADISPLFRISVDRTNLQFKARSSNSPSGRAFSDLTCSCRRQNWRFEVALANFTSAIMSASRVTARMSAADIVRFLALMSFRYRLPGLVTFRPTLNGNDSMTTTLEVKRWNWIPSELNISCFECVKSMTTTFNTLLKVDLEARALMDLHSKFPPHEDTAYNTANRSLSDSPFISVSPSDWAGVLREFVRPIYPDAKYIVQETGTNVNDLIVHLARPANQPLTVAYLVIQTVMAVYQEFADFNVFRNPPRKADCSPLVLRVYELQESFEAQLVATPDRDDHVREIFDIIRRQVASDALSSFTFSEEDHLRIKEALDSIEVLFPRDAAIAYKPPPIITFNFPADLLTARSFVFEVQQEKARKGTDNLKLRSYIPDVFRRGNVIFIPASMYFMLNFERDHKLFTNLAVVGVRLARELWSFLLDIQTWTNETMRKMRSFQLCFNSPDFSKTGANTTRRSAQSMATAVSSILKVVDKSEWLRVQNVSNTVHMSRGQLFYLLMADSLCGDIISRSCEEEDVNVAIKNTPDFSEVFGCAPDAAMNSNQSLCQV
ncbi:unnamed protein product, partial [Ixodes hexagonus]